MKIREVYSLIVMDDYNTLSRKLYSSKQYAIKKARAAMTAGAKEVIVYATSTATQIYILPEE